MRIGIITHEKEIEEKFSRLADKMDCELVFREGALAGAIKVAQELESEVEALITHEVAKSHIAPHTTLPVATLRIEAINVIEAISKARKIGHKIAYVDFIKDEYYYDFDHIKDILPCDAVMLQISSLEEIPLLVDDIIREGYDTVVSISERLCRFAKKTGLNAVNLGFSEENMINAIRTAKSLIAVERSVKEKTQGIKVIMDNIEEGMIAINEQAKIISANAAVCRLVRYDGDPTGKSIDEFLNLDFSFSQMLSVSDGVEIIKARDGTEMVITQKDIISDGHFSGNIIRIEALSKIQSVEIKARKKSNVRGFVAKNNFDNMIGRSAPFKRTMAHAMSFALAEAAILIIGESGTGKELFAQSIHNYSHRRNGPFVAVNCATLPENLLDSELFGYESGAFTGAKKEGKPGLFELAHGGTLFLDEIGEMPISLQAKLLRVLQEKEVRRIGGEQNIPVSVRVISATNRNLADEVQKGSFRQDLYYRINILHLRIPPLRERREDIIPLCSAFARKYARTPQDTIQFTPKQQEYLKSYGWPGNVRELQNFVERISVLCHGGLPSNEQVEAFLEGDKMTAEVLPAQPEGLENDLYLRIPIGSMHEMENHIISDLYERYDGDQKRLSYTLDLSNTTLWRRLKEIRKE